MLDEDTSDDCCDALPDARESGDTPGAGPCVETALGDQPLRRQKGSRGPASAENAGKKIVATEMVAGSIADGASVAATDPPCRLKRFGLGDRVLARVDGWRPGTISQLDYREDDWHPDHPTAPYQIVLDSTCRFDQHYVFAPMDDDDVVRTMPKNAEGILLALDQGKAEKHACSDCGDTCPLHHVCEDTVNCPMYHYCGKDGRTKTRLWKKLANRQQERKNRWLCSGCERGVCENEAEASIDEIMAFVEGGQSVDPKGQKSVGGPTKKRKKKKAKRAPLAKIKPNNEADAKVNANGSGQDKLRGSDDDVGHLTCACDCHAIAASGRQAVIAKLREGVDFSSLFQEDLFELADLDSNQQEELVGFERRLQEPHLNVRCVAP